MSNFTERLTQIKAHHNQVIQLKNEAVPDWKNGIVQRYHYPVLTAEHIPLEWRYDLNPKTNPHCLERIGVNAVFNAGAIEWENKIVLAARVEGYDRKSYFAICESDTGVDQFRFRERPMELPQADEMETNVYDMRLTKHEDGYIYGLFCTERQDPSAPQGDVSSAIAQCGIVRTKDFCHWERLPNLKSSAQQRNVVLHPEFVDGKYALYTRPSDGFVEVGRAGGIGFALVDNITCATLKQEIIIDSRQYHTIKETKNGLGAPPLKTSKGWLHIAHGVRTTVAGLRYVLYCFVTDLKDPSKVIAIPGGYFLAPRGDERVGDVSNVLFCNGAVQRENGEVYIYYASSDTRLHVAVTHIDILMDYCFHTPSDGLCSAESVQKINALIDKNREV